MKHIEKAIRDAVEEGWHPDGFSPESVILDEFDGEIAYISLYGGDEHEELELHLEQIFLDPAFWQALGKARGWGESNLAAGSVSDGLWPISWWKIYAVNFFQHIMDGDDAESFFATLSNKETV